MGIEDNKEIVAKVYEAVYSGDHKVIDELVSENYVRHALNKTEPIIGRAMFKQKRKGEWITKQVIAERELVMTQRVIRSIHDTEYLGMAPTGKLIEIAHISIERVVEGQIVEGWGLADNLSFAQQVNGLPVKLN